MKEGQGELGKIGLPRLLHLIYMKQDEAAVLDITREPVKKMFFFRKGIPVAASSNILGEVLGRLLMQEGIITQKDYESSLEVVLRDKRRHGEVLISMGLLTSEQLDEFLRLQLKRRLLKIFDWEEGRYSYYKASKPQNLSSYPLHPAEVILEGISLGFYPVSRIKAELKPSLDRRLALKPGAGLYKVDDFRLNLQEKRFLETLGGQTALEDALASSDLLRHRALAITLSLIITGLLIDPEGARIEQDSRLEETEEAQAPETRIDSKLNAELLFMKAKTALGREDFPAAIEILQEITDINPVEGEYWACLGWAIYKADPGRIAESEKLLKDSLDLNNDLDFAWLCLGRLFLAQERTEVARKAFSNALQKNPWNTEALSELKRLELNAALPEGPGPLAGFLPEPALLAGQAESLDALAKAVKKRSGPALLEAEAGAGKTTALLELLGRISTDKVLPVLILSPARRELDLMKQINLEAGCPSEATTVKEQLLNLGMRVSQNKIQGGHTLIIIDEAHALSNGSLKLIQYLTRLKSLQIILSGAPGLSERLKAPEFKELDERLGLRLGAGGMDRQEASGLCASRGAQLSEEELDAVFGAAGGNPGAMLRQASRLEKADLSQTPGSAPEEAAGLPPSIEKQPAHDIIEITGYEALSPGTEAEPPRSAQTSGKDEAVKPEAPAEKEARQEPVPIIHNEPAEQDEVAAALSAPEAEPVPPAKAQEPAAPRAATPAKRPEPTEATPPPATSLSPPSAPSAPARHAEPPPTSETAPRRTGTLRLVFWIVLMLVAGLAAGSVIGTLWFNRTAPPAGMEEIAPQPAQPPPALEPAAAPEASVDAEAAPAPAGE